MLRDAYRSGDRAAARYAVDLVGARFECFGKFAERPVEDRPHQQLRASRDRNS